MRLIFLLLCLGYWVLLTVLLLAPNPAALVGLRAVPTLPWGKFGVHLLAFTILSLLVHCSRWPARLCWPLIAFLMVYGIATEWLQRFVPTRTVRLMDAVENMLGVAAGVGIYALLRRLMRPWEQKSSVAADMVRCAAADESVRQTDV
jgi:hypothetical protein